MFEMIQKIELELFWWINQRSANAVFDFLMPILSDLKFFAVPLAAAWLYLILRKGIKGRMIAICLVALIGLTEFLCSDVIKPAVGRLRPYDAVSNVRTYSYKSQKWRITPELVNKIPGKSRSFPSAHATNIFAAAVFLTYYFRKLWPLWLLIAVAVSYSRVYLGVHFPSDVFAGALLGTFCAAALTRLTDTMIVYFSKGKAIAIKD